MTFRTRNILAIFVAFFALALVGCEMPGLDDLLSDNANLEILSVKSNSINRPLSPEFKPNVTNYQVFLPTGTTGITITAYAEDWMADVTGDGYRSVEVGDNLLEVKVTAENGKNKVYKITATVAQDTDLISATLSNAETDASISYSPSFNKNTTSYSATVNFAVEKIKLETTKANDEANVTGVGEHDLVVGANEFPVVVSVGDESKTYTFTVTRSAASTNANLASLTVKKVELTGNYSLSPSFNASTLDYTVQNVPTTAEQIQILVTTPANSYSTVSGLTGEGYKDLDYGNNEFSVTVTAQDGVTTKVYKVTAVRPEPSSNADLSALSVSGATLTPAFDASITEYTATTTYFAKTFTVSATKSHAAATVSGTGSQNFTGDEAVVEITVTAENSTQKVYTVTVTRGNIHTFRAQKVTDGTWYNATGTLLATGEHSLVFAENGHGITPETAQEIADEFDNEIYEPIVDAFGEASDVDNNGKVVIFLLDIIDGYSGGGFVAGYFDPTHQFAKTTYTNSNEMDMLFMDVDPLVPASDQFYGTLAHEFQHLINFNVAYLEGNGVEFDVWINEGLSTAAEYVYSGTIDVDGRVAWFNADPTGSISAGNNFFVWNGFWENEGDQLSNYATAYLFFQWLRIHAPNGVEIYGDIISSGSRNYQAVLSAATASGGEFPSTWSTLMRAWFLANFFGMSDESTGIFSYEGEIETLVYGYPATGSIYLSPGEGVYLQLSEAFTPLSTPAFVTYVGFTSAGVLDTLSPYSGDLLLIYNSNPSISGPDVVALRPSVQAGLSPLLSVTKTGIQLPESYPIGVLLQPGGGVGTLLPASPSGRPGDFGTRR